MDSNITKSIEKAEENKKFVIPSVEKVHEKYFKKVTELKAGDVVVSALCKFCHHPLRAEAEAKWEQTKGGRGVGSYAAVIKFLNSHSDEYGVKFNHQNVANHLTYHYEQQMKRMWLREYGTNLSEIMNYRIGKEEMFEGMIQTMLYKLHETAANPELDSGRQVDMMTKLSKAITDISLVQGKLRGDLDTVDIYKDKVETVIFNFIDSEKDESRKRKLLEQLDLAKSELVE